MRGVLYQFDLLMSLLKCYKYNTDVYFKEHLCDIKITFGISVLVAKGKNDFGKKEWYENQNPTV